MPALKTISKWLMVLGIISLIYGGRVFVGEEQEEETVTVQHRLTASYTNADQWHHFAFTVDRDNEIIRLYLDGIEADSCPFEGTIRTTAVPLLIGGQIGTRFFCGAIDNVKIFSRALSSGEVKALYNEDAGSDDSNLVGYWKMDENSATKIVKDSSLYHNDGIAQQNTMGMATDGKIAGALRFDGIFDRINCGNKRSLDTPDGLTVAAWINSPLTVQEGRFISKCSDDDYGWLASVTANLLEVEVYSNVVIRQRFLASIGFIPLRGELIFFFAAVAALLHFRKPINLRPLKNIRKTVFFTLLMLLGCIFVATAISFFRYDLWFDKFGIVLIIKLLLNIGIFLLLYIWLRSDTRFYKRLCWALYIPPLISLPFLFVPGLAEKFVAIAQNSRFLTTGSGAPMMFTSVDRFSGFTLNPINMGLMNVIALSFLFTLFLYNHYKKRHLKSLVYLFLSAGMCALNIWSLSRSIIVATIMVLFATNISVGLYFKKNAARIFLYNVAAVLLVICVFTFFSEGVIEKLLSKLTLTQLAEARNPIWRYYLGLVPGNLWGLGLNYEQKFLAKHTINFVNAHSFLLESWAYGGIGLISALFYLIWKAFKNIGRQIKGVDDSMFVYLVGTRIAVVGLLTVGLFSGLLFDLHFWILLAMAVGCSLVKDNSETIKNHESS